MFLGEDLLAYLVLALGGALFVGNVLAVVRPPAEPREGDLPRAPGPRRLPAAAPGRALLVGHRAGGRPPPAETREGDLARAPVARSVTMAAVGLVAAVWALASLVAG